MFVKLEVEEGLKELVDKVCGEVEIEIVGMECEKDHRDMVVNAVARV
ncbi:transposase, partial [Paenibacillus xylanexedens]